MEAPDLFRTVMVSLAAMLIGTVVFGAFTAWRDRSLPVPRRAPLHAIIVFAVGYVLLLVQLVVSRLEKIGEDIGPAAILAMLALLMNAVAMLMLVSSAQPTDRNRK